MTEPFVDVLERHLSHWRPEATFPRIVLDHPIQNVSDALLERRAEQIVEGVERLLKL